MRAGSHRRIRFRSAPLLRDLVRPDLGGLRELHATTTFTLGDGSTLTLDESGVVCGPGPSLLKGPSLTAYGNPRAFSVSWEVDGATGQFAGMTGRGAATGLTAGAVVKARPLSIPFSRDSTTTEQQGEEQ